MLPLLQIKKLWTEFCPNSWVNLLLCNLHSNPLLRKAHLYNSAKSLQNHSNQSFVSIFYSNFLHWPLPKNFMRIISQKFLKNLSRCCEEPRMRYRRISETACSRTTSSVAKRLTPACIRSTAIYTYARVVCVFTRDWQSRRQPKRQLCSHFS